jgi:hypothetical protein
MVATGFEDVRGCGTQLVARLTAPALGDIGSAERELHRWRATWIKVVLEEAET